jgi:hypothetical protein
VCVSVVSVVVASVVLGPVVLVHIVRGVIVQSLTQPLLQGALHNAQGTEKRACV